MKRLVVTTALALALGLGFASAQNINRSLQGSQDPRGPVGLDPSNSAYFPGHMNAFGPTTIPSLTTCGASTLASGSTDNQGRWNQQTTTACILVFGVPFNAPPNCVISASGATSIPFISATATTSFSVTNIQAATSIFYICLGNQ